MSSTESKCSNFYKNRISTIHTRREFKPCIIRKSHPTMAWNPIPTLHYKAENILLMPSSLCHFTVPCARNKEHFSSDSIIHIPYKFFSFYFPILRQKTYYWCLPLPCHYTFPTTRKKEHFSCATPLICNKQWPSPLFFPAKTYLIVVAST